MSEEIELQNIGQKSIYWLAAVIVISIVIFAVVFLFNSYTNSLRYVPPELVAKTQASRFLYSPQCFLAVDSAGKSSAGLIDFTKFTETQLNQCHPTPDRTVYNFKLVLKHADTGRETTIQTLNFRNQIATTHFYPVRIKEGNTIAAGRLTVYVQAPQQELIRTLAQRSGDS